MCLISEPRARLASEFRFGLFAKLRQLDGVLLAGKNSKSDALQPVPAVLSPLDAGQSFQYLCTVFLQNAIQSCEIAVRKACLQILKFHWRIVHEFLQSFSDFDESEVTL